MWRSFWYLFLASSAITLPSLLNADSAADADSLVRSLADQYVWRHELYSENILLTREEILVFSAQHRSNFGGASPFDASGVCGLGLHAGYDIASPAGLDAKYYNYSFAYVAPGLLCRGAFYALVLESRHKFYFEQDDEVIGNGKRPAWDHRAVVALYHDRETSLGAHWQLFNQAYFESVFTSGDKQNLIAAGHNRFGLQWRLPQSPHRLRVFLEPYVAIDRNKWFYNNRWELRSGAAWIMQINQAAAIWAMAGPVYVQHYGQSAELAPLKDQPWGTRALLILNVTLGERS